MKFQRYQIKVRTFGLTLPLCPLYKKIFVFPRLIGGGVTYNYFPPIGVATKMEETKMVVSRVNLNREKVTKLLSAKFDTTEYFIEDPQSYGTPLAIGVHLRRATRKS